MDKRTLRAALTAELGVGTGIFLVAWFLGATVNQAIVVGVGFGAVTAMIILGASLMAGRKNPTMTDTTPTDAPTEADRG